MSLYTTWHKVLVALYCEFAPVILDNQHIIVLFVHSEWLHWWSQCAATPWMRVPLSRLPHPTGCYHWVKDCSCTPWEGNVFLRILVPCLSNFFCKLVTPWYLSQSLLTLSKSPDLTTFKVNGGVEVPNWNMHILTTCFITDIISIAGYISCRVNTVFCFTFASI